jgi:ribulose-phosphate 3-epimerase
MDQRSAKQAQEILERARGDPALEVNAGGEGPLSAEWMSCKALWIKQNEPDIWKQATYICEYQDYLNYQLTGVLCASSCNAAARWHWDGVDCLQGARPTSFYQKCGMPELVDKLPQTCISMGTPIGQGLTEKAAQQLHLPVGLPVMQGGPDAFVGMIGLGCVQPGQLCLITGSSHLHCVVTHQPTRSPGIWGAYRGAPLPHVCFAEGGQSSTGSLLKWVKTTLFGNAKSYQELDEEASQVAPGANGLIVLETLQGSRTPVTDPLAKGALVGLSLRHTQAHIWRACLEAVCLGTRACLEGLAAAGHDCDEIVLAGGVANSNLWLQLHADVTGKRVVLCETSQAPLLGCAILAAVGAGIHESVEKAVQVMVRRMSILEPNLETAAIYTKLYDQVYSNLSPAVRSVVHAMAALRGGAQQRTVVISPSLLACDWAHMADEVERCVQAKTPHLHVDIFDGVYLDSPLALTFGPKMVQDIGRPDVYLDLHMCVHRPRRYVSAMANAGASRFIFQWEAVKDVEEAIELAQEIVDAGMECGVSINPETPVENIYPLLERSSLVTAVDVLAVNPGFGGQNFQEGALEKMRQLSEWRSSHRDVVILVDGGINSETAINSIAAGADILVAGTFLFQHPSGLATGIKELKQS